jgi:hypothetical protein
MAIDDRISAKTEEHHVRQHAGKFVIVACVGIAIGWFGHGQFGDVRAQRFPADQHSAGVAASNPSAGVNLDSSVRAAPDAPAMLMKSDSVGLTAGAPGVPPTQNFNSADKAINATPITSDEPRGANVAGTPGNKEALSDSQAAKTTPAETLLNAAGVKCDFSPGNSGFWHNQTLSDGTAAWQGGPLVYDSINTASGTATMTGNVSLTGSQTDGLNVRAVPTTTALHLYGVAPNGTLTSTTIFGAARNAAGHYNAVMSYHGPTLRDQESAQFYGTCDTTG